MDARITQLEQGIRFRLDGMVQRGKSTSAYLNRNLLEQFKNAQRERFQTENSSQQGKWEPLDARYLKRRMRKFPASGKAILVRTQRMAKGAQGLDSSYYYKTVSDNSFVFGINLGALPYAKYPGMVRPFMSFKKETLEEWHKGIGDYIFRGKS